MPVIFKVAAFCLILYFAAVVVSPATVREQEYALKIQGENVGVCKMSVQDTAQGFELVYSLTMTFSRMSQNLNFYINYVVITDDRLNLQSFTYTSNISGKERKLTGVVVGDTFVLDDGSSESIYEWDSSYVLEPMAYFRLARGGLQPGKMENLAVFDPESSSLTQMQLTVEEQTEDTFKVSSSDGQLIASAVVGADGWLVEEVYNFAGIEITITSANGGGGTIPGGIDMILSFRIPLTGEYNPNAQEVTYRLAFSEEHPLTLKSDFRQQILSVSPGAIELAVGGDFYDVLTAEEKESLLYLGAPYCADDEQIIKLAEEIAEKEPGDDLSRAEKLSDWVKANIASSDYSQVFSDALTVLARKNGDCTEHSTLLVGLLRAQGIPARAVVGVVYLQGYFYYHMWVEAYVADYWISLDPTLGYVNPYHIKLAEVNPRGEFTYDELLALISSLSMGKLSITVLSAK